MRGWRAWTQAALIALVFLGFRLVFKPSQNAEMRSGPFPLWRTRVQREPNADASLSIPLLDKINNFWLVDGATQIRNFGNIRLTSRGQLGQYGVVVSNGAGDNVLDDFETVVSFKIHNTGVSSQFMGDGMVVAISPEKDYIQQNMMSSYGRSQYEHNSGGIIGNDRGLMGLPRNLPGLVVVIDTYKNDPKTRLKPPFMSVLLNMDPRKHHYSAATDGTESTGHNLCPLIKLKRSLMSGKDTKLRIIYLESIGFLKVDIKYPDSNEWIELYQQDSNLYLPKNRVTGQRYIAIGALTGQATQTVEIQGVETSEFHWDEHEEEGFDYAKEMQYFLAQEYGERVKIGEDDYGKWLQVKRQGGTDQDPVARNKSKHSTLYYMAKISFVMFFLYGLSLSIRISIKRAVRLRRKKSQASILG